MRRFLVESRILADQPAILDDGLFRHIHKVLRLSPGDKIVLFDGAGQECVATIQQVASKQLTVFLEPIKTPASMPVTPAITLIQALPKGEKPDFVIQKATELGIGSIVIFHAVRSVVKISPEQASKRIVRWEKIAGEAARQSGRSTTPVISYTETLALALKPAKQELKIHLWEEKQTPRLKEAFAKSDCPKDIAILVGPEGGLTKEEAALTHTEGFIPVSLGPRILRTETAGIAMLAIIQYLWGDMG